jgi:inositol hexakisphosphate/diphosphoinositol-pentakisphosphate kinase
VASGAPVGVHVVQCPPDQLDKDLTPEDIVSLNPLGRKSLKDALEFIKNPRKMCDEIYEYVSMLYQTILRHKLGQESVPSGCCLCASVSMVCLYNLMHLQI